MTRSRGQFDTRHGDAHQKNDGDSVVEWVPTWVSFHRFESLLVCWFLLGAVGIGLVFGLPGLAMANGESAPEVVRTVFWTTGLVAIPLLAASRLAHAVVDT